MCKLTDMRNSSSLQVKWVIFDEVGLPANAIAQMGVIVCGSDLRGVCEESRKASSASMQFEALQHAYSQLAQYFRQAQAWTASRNSHAQTSQLMRIYGPDRD